MAVKKKISEKAPKKGIKYDGKYEDRQMNAAELKEAQKLVADIGSGKKRGFVTAFEVTEDGDVQGIAYIEDLTPIEVASVVIHHSGFDFHVYADAVKDALLESLAKKMKISMPDHEHDEHGNCLI